jgi:hypothetical protein
MGPVCVDSVTRELKLTLARIRSSTARRVSSSARSAKTTNRPCVRAASAREGSALARRVASASHAKLPWHVKVASARTRSASPNNSEMASRQCPNDLWFGWNSCQNGACGGSSFPSGDCICCQSNGVIWWGVDYYCTETGELGDECSRDETCKSGFCVNDVCVQQKLANGVPCLSDDDCQSNSCGIKSYTPEMPAENVEYVCCSSNATVRDSERDYCTAAQNIRQKCNEKIPQVCKSGLCSRGVCVTY